MSTKRSQWKSIEVSGNGRMIFGSQFQEVTLDFNIWENYRELFEKQSEPKRGNRKFRFSSGVLERIVQKWQT